MRPSLRVPRWAAPIALVLTLCGLGVSIYLTIAHYDAHVSLVCSANGAINCEKVTSSAQSKVFGIPVAVLGLAYFVAMVPLQLPAAWRSNDPRIRFGRVLYCIAGVGFICYLIYAEAVIIKAICLWCTSVHVITFIIFVVTALATALSLPVVQHGYDDDDADADAGADIDDDVDDVDDDTSGISDGTPPTRGARPKSR
jgi:uncharacterized membrane protein